VKPVNYDLVAPAFDERYRRNRYEGIRECVRRFLENTDGRIAEVGCGTGHWLAEFSTAGRVLVGLDLSEGMLRRAREHIAAALLVRATAERLPLAAACLSRVFCVNALHHFDGKEAFIGECRRVLAPGGRFLTIGLDPHHGGDTWWLYDYFPAAKEANLRRSASTESIRRWLRDAGFVDVATETAQRMPAERPFDVALRQGLLERHSTSELMIISDAEFEAGMTRLHAEKPVLRADLTIFATTAVAPG
jgi:ubiquinone/menaquinone biosynthesis C-methylase UbiE